MDGSRFDSLTQRLATGWTRRSILRGLIGGAAALAIVPRELILAAPEKVTICHVTGNQDAPYKIMSLPEPAVAAHYAHGDFEPFDCGGEWNCFGPELLFNCGPGYDCPTGATTFCPGGLLDSTSSDQAKAACEACFGVGACVHNDLDCSGAGWLEDFAPESEPPAGSPVFGYEIGLCNPANPQPAGRVFFGTASDPVSDYGFWGLDVCPE